LSVPAASTAGAPSPRSVPLSQVGPSLLPRDYGWEGVSNYVKRVKLGRSLRWHAESADARPTASSAIRGTSEAPVSNFGALRNY
jgi:hypothetical protein